MYRWNQIFFCVLALAVTPQVSGLAQKPTAEQADTIYHGGDIVTVDERNPFTEAVAVKDGKIVATGSKADVMQWQGKATHLVDLAGRTMLPGFVDAHGHCFGVGFQAVSANLLSPPDHTVVDIATLQAELRKFGATAVSKQYGMIIGFGYDDAQLREQRHPNRHDLDAVSTDVPVIIIHQSGHLSVMNSKALSIAGVDASSPNPPGGVIERESDGKTLSGVLQETAHFLNVMKVLPQLGEAELDDLALAGQKLYAANGFTMAQEGRSSAAIDKTWMRLAEADKLVLDLVSYPDLTGTDEPFGLDGPWHTGELKQRYRIGGVKLNFDGSPQGKTAYLSRPYFVPPEGRNAAYRGYATLEEEQVLHKIGLCYEKGWQFLIHCNGDAASDLMIAGVREAQKKYGVDSKRRDVMVHCQTVREDQLDAMKTLGIIPSMFGMHCFYWGDWHRDSVLGAERAERISPARSALRREMIFTQHHDAPVALPSAIRILSSVVTRRTRSGDILGATQTIPVDVAIKSLTLWPAYQHFEEANRGSIEVGKLADFVILDQNPHKVEELLLADLVVLETIKEGKTIYTAP